MVLPSFTFCLSVAVSVPFFQSKLSAALTDTAPRRQTASAKTLNLIIPYLVPRNMRGTVRKKRRFAFAWREAMQCTSPHMQVRVKRSTSFGDRDAIARKEHDRRQLVGGRKTDDCSHGNA